MQVEQFVHPRRKDWGSRWVEFIKDSIDLAPELVLDWDSEGVTCYSWVGDGIEAITGHNPHDQFRGKYNSVLTICRLIKDLNFGSMDEVIAAQFKEVPISLAQTGDIVLVKTVPYEVGSGEELFADSMMPHGIALVDPPFYYAITEKGLVKGQLYQDGVRAFAVGRSI